MNINDYYNLVLYIIAKNQDGGYMSPDEFNLLINQVQTSFLDYLLGEFQQYQYNSPKPRVGYSQNETTRTRLTPIIYGYILNIDSTGFSPYPGDYQQTDAMWTMYGYSRIRYTEQERLYSTVNSEIDPVATNPIYLIEDEGFRFFPNNINQTKLNYVRTPPEIKWAYTLDVDGRAVYDPVNSIQPIWYTTDMLEIISRLLRMSGVNLQENQINQYANEITKSGQ